jgi:hypothetical protein
MCRYAFKKYKPRFACFNCQKTFKRRNLFDITGDDNIESKPARCPQCRELMADMGKDFAAPKKTDDKAWQHLKTLYSVGIAFHSCGCGGPGLVPKDQDALRVYFEQKLADYETELSWWRKRVQPATISGRDKERNRDGERMNRVGVDIRDQNGIDQTDKAIEFWLERRREVEAKLKILNAGIAKRS